MNIFLAGGTGAIGQFLIPQLVQRGHRVVAMTRRRSRLEQLRRQGVEAQLCDVFDTEGLRDVIVAAQPEAVIHQLTAIPPRIDPRRVNELMAPTNRLRTEGTRNLLDAAIAGGARRFLAQSIAFAYSPKGRGPATESDPLHLDAPAAFRNIIEAVSELESLTMNSSAIEGTVLRYGLFYGPGTAYAADGSFADDARRRRLPIVGAGQGIFSFVHLEDAAAATVAAVDSWRPGVYNIVDDEPVAFGDWLPWYCAQLRAPRPWRVPTFLGRLGAGPYGIYMLNEQRGADNSKAREELNWRPRYTDWRDGFGTELASQPAP